MARADCFGQPMVTLGIPSGKAALGLGHQAIRRSKSPSRLTPVTVLEWSDRAG